MPSEQRIDEINQELTRFLFSLARADAGLSKLADVLGVEKGTGAYAKPGEGTSDNKDDATVATAEGMKPAVSNLNDTMLRLHRLLESGRAKVTMQADPHQEHHQQLTERIRQTQGHPTRADDGHPRQSEQPAHQDHADKEKKGYWQQFKDLFTRAFLSKEARAVWQADTDRFEAERLGDVVSTHGREAKAVGAWMEHVGVPGGGVAKAGGEFLDWLGESVEQLRKWNDMLQRSNFQFAEFSAHMAQVEAEQERFDILNSQKRGERRAESAQYLAEGRRGLESKFNLAEDVIAAQKNWFMGYIDRKIEDVITAVAPKNWEQMLEQLFGRPNRDGMDMNEWQQRIADQWDQQRGRPDRLRR